MFDERSVIAAYRVNGISSGPHVIRRQSCHSPENILVGWRGTRAQNEAPAAAVPVQGQWLLRGKSNLDVPDCPNVIGRDSRDSVEERRSPRGEGTGDSAPLSAIPVLNQRLKEQIVAAGSSHGPHVIRRGCCDREELVEARSDV